MTTRTSVSPRPLRLAAVANSCGLLQWQKNCLDTLRESSSVADLELYLVEQPARASAGCGLIDAVYEHWLRQQAVLQPSAVEADRGWNRIECDTISGQDLSTVDVVLDFTAELAFEDLSRWPQLQLLRFDFPIRASGLSYLDIPKAIADGSYALQVQLIRCEASAQDSIVCSGRFPFVYYSRAEVFQHVFNSCAGWPRRYLEGRSTLCSTSALTPAPEELPPRSRLWYSAKERMISLAKRRLSTPIFGVGIMEGSFADLLERTRVDAEAIELPLTARWLPEPAKGTFVADCFLERQDGRSSLLVEEYSFLERLGRISRIDVEKSFAKSELVLEAIYASDSHLSYPQLFTFKGRQYALCENSAGRRVPIFRTEGDQWQLVTELFVDQDIVDPSMIEHEGRLWMFCTKGSRPQDELHVYVAEAVEGPWTPHRCNPIKIDITAGRPAGNLFVHEGRLFRPSQDCAAHYGAAITLCEVLELNEYAFRERVLCRLTSAAGDKYSGGCHTFSYNQGVVAVDGFHWGCRPGDIFEKLYRFVLRGLHSHRSKNAAVSGSEALPAKMREQ